MKKVFILFFIFLYLNLHATVKSNDQRALGQKVFSQKRCTLCHKMSLSSTAPSIFKIGKIYSGKERLLVKYLQGKRKPLIKKFNSNIMKGQISRLRSVNKQKLKAIARYIVTIHDREF